MTIDPQLLSRIQFAFEAADRLAPGEGSTALCGGSRSPRPGRPRASSSSIRSTSRHDRQTADMHQAQAQIAQLKAQIGRVEGRTGLRRGRRPAVPASPAGFTLAWPGRTSSPATLRRNCVAFRTPRWSSMAIPAKRRVGHGLKPQRIRDDLVLLMRCAPAVVILPNFSRPTILASDNVLSQKLARRRG
jgi:hypothetical protein